MDTTIPDRSGDEYEYAPEPDELAEGVTTSLEEFLTEADFEGKPYVPNPEKKLTVARERTPIESLLVKLEGWLLQQPEFILILQAPRDQRRRASRLIAKTLLTYPSRGRSFGP